METLISAAEHYTLVIYMRHSWILIVACVLILQTVHTEQAHSQRIHDFYDWTFEPNTDGTLHIKTKVTFGSAARAFGMSTSVLSPIRNMKAWEAETGDPVKITEETKGDRIIYTFDIPGWQGKGYEFYFEFDHLFLVRELSHSRILHISSPTVKIIESSTWLRINSLATYSAQG